MSGGVTSQVRDHGESALAWDEAAALLDVPPAALRQWSERLAFPCDIGRGGSPRFRRAALEALRDALPTAHSVSGAIHVARRGSTPNR
jgi:hypothetical protein